MDFGTINTKLLNNAYAQDAWHLIEDIRLVFDNAQKFNKKNTYVYMYATEVGF